MIGRASIRNGTRRRRVLRVLLTGLAACLAAAAPSRAQAGQAPPQAQSGQAQPSQAASPVVLDRAVAVVNRHVILASDLDDEIRLSVLDPNDAGQNGLTKRQALEQLISRALIEQQIRQEDMQAIEPSQQEVNDRLDQLRKQLPACVRQNCATDAGWNAFLDVAWTDDRSASKHIFATGLRSSALSSCDSGRVSKSPSSRSKLTTTTRCCRSMRPAKRIPPVDQVASRIQEILLQQQVNMLFDTWLNNLRQQGDVEVLDPDLRPPASAVAPAPETPVASSRRGKGGR